jgi:dipeptidase D
MTFVSSLEPQALWKHFDEILTIPRPSKNEEQMRRYVLSVAEKHGFSTQIDAAGNVIVEKPGTPGHESAPVTLLQSHLDMVCEKNSDVELDFSKDPLRPVQDGDYLTADGTTLGSDNGIGVAAMLAVLESKDIAHGPLELLFTIDEETGLTGAGNLAPDLLTGRRLLNLDTEEEGALYVGCAGGADTELLLPLTRDGSAGQTLSLKLSGLKGGHSGVDIHLQRGNAIKLLARALYAASLEVPFLLGELRGGTAHNAIPREAFATVLMGSNQRESFEQAVRREIAAIEEEYRPADPGLKLEISEGDSGVRAWAEGSTARVLGLLEALPHGVQTMSYDIPDLVETSTNLATVNEKDGRLSVLMSSRSSVASALEALRREIRATAELAGAVVEEHGGYPGWKPNMDSELLRVMKEVHQRVVGSEPEVKAVHAGLETGIIGEKYPGMDMISFGPQIEFPHSPDERVHIASVNRFWNLLVATLEELG